MNSLSAQKLLWEQQIKNEYLKYQKFIGSDNMPKYKINFVDGSKRKISYAMEALIYKRPVILNVNMGFMINGQSKHCQPTLYHEFTHMLDSENLFKDKDPKERKSVLALYTEYHASQIEFLRFMEFKSINGIKCINPSSKFYEFDEEKTVLEYYNKRCSLLSESIDKYNSNASTENYRAIIDSYMYVFVIKSIYDKVIKMIELPQVDCLFHEKVIGLYSILQDNNVNDLWDILLLCSQVLDKTYIVDSLQLKNYMKGNQHQ